MSSRGTVDLEAPKQEAILSVSRSTDGEQPHLRHDPMPEVLKHDPDFQVIWEEVRHYGRMFGLTWRQFLDRWRSGTIEDDSWEKAHYAMLAASVEQALIDVADVATDS